MRHITLETGNEALQYNMSIEEFMDRVAMQRQGIEWQEFLTKCRPEYPDIKRAKLKKPARPLSWVF